MSDDDRDIDVESDEGEDSDSRQPTPSRQTAGSQYYSQAEKRAHHNALERKRRDYIKDSFSCLRDSVPVLSGEKVASRAQILKEAAAYIVQLADQDDADEKESRKLKRENFNLTTQIENLEKAKTRRCFVVDRSGGRELNFNETESDTSDTKESVQTESDTSDSEESVPRRRKKKLKV